MSRLLTFLAALMSAAASALLGVIFSIALLLVLVLRFKWPAFLVLLLVSTVAGFLLGMEPTALIEAMRAGMGGTLGFVAVVVGLGSLLGAMLEASGGVQTIAQVILKRFGTQRAVWALGLIGFLIAIPVFFDVAFIIIAPILYGLRRSSGRPLLYFALPLLAGLAVTHAFIPPTPGPITVADLLGADLGWLILFGVLAGLPAMLVAGPLYARWLLPRLRVNNTVGAEAATDEPDAIANPVGFVPALTAIVLPLVLVLLATITKQWGSEGLLADIIAFIGHPFAALMLACLYGYIVFGIRRGVAASDMHDIMVRALEPAGIVVLVTGAGGVFKQVLVDSGAGAHLADTIGAASLSPLVFGFLVALILRLAQGSATVAMITAAGLAAPVVSAAGLPPQQVALVVVAIASGATACSHVNDSGFWLVSRYLHLSEAETLKSWTVASTLVGLVGFATALVLSWIV